MTILNNKKGFTLVEIVIVLAIAALVLAGILFAVRGAQESRRDAARRDAAGTIGALLEEYAGNHNGVYPTGVGTGATQMNPSILTARTGTPDGTEYAVSIPAGSFGNCPNSLGQDVVQVAYSGRKWQVAMGLEGGVAAFCAQSGN